LPDEKCDEQGLLGQESEHQTGCDLSQQRGWYNQNGTIYSIGTCSFSLDLYAMANFFLICSNLHLEHAHSASLFLFHQFFICTLQPAKEKLLCRGRASLRISLNGF
jgi:hypothetical protein